MTNQTKTPNVETLRKNFAESVCVQLPKVPKVIISDVSARQYTTQSASTNNKKMVMMEGSSGMKRLEKAILGRAYGSVLGESSNIIYGLTQLEREEVEKSSIDGHSLDLKDVLVLEESNPKRKSFVKGSKKLRISLKAFDFSNM